MSEAIHPGQEAITLHGQYAAHRGQVIAKRATAADLRRRAKSCDLKADPFALRKQAKPISEEAAAAARSASKALAEFLKKAKEAQQVLTQRMPPEWQAWGVTKTRAYTNTLAALSIQLTRKHPKPAVVAGAIQHLLGHAEWHEGTLQALHSVKPSAKDLPPSARLESEHANP